MILAGITYTASHDSNIPNCVLVGSGLEDAEFTHKFPPAQILSLYRVTNTGPCQAVNPNPESATLALYEKHNCRGDTVHGAYECISERKRTFLHLRYEQFFRNWKLDSC